MSSFKTLAMAAAVAKHQDIIVKNQFFGLIQKAYYSPTGSPLLALQYDYSTENGNRIKQVLSAQSSQLADAVTDAGLVAKAPMGPFRVEVCLSADRQFAAVQPFGYSDFEYRPLADVRFFKAHEAELIAQLFT